MFLGLLFRNNRENARLAENVILLAVYLDGFAIGLLENDLIALLHRHGDDRAVLIAAGAGRDDRAALGALLLYGVGDDDAACGDFLRGEPASRPHGRKRLY
jgi:hypothetical protein